MTQREILIYPQHSQALRRESEGITIFKRDLLDLILDLKDTLAAHSEGIGLAAPQINIHKRVVIVRLGQSGIYGEDRRPPLALVNPVIRAWGNPQRDCDGCLSFPGLYGETTRPHKLRVSFQDEAGKSIVRQFSGFNAALVHHEIDHLNGVLFIDHIEELRNLFRIGEDKLGQPVRVPVAAR
jgi:peptide deformylase